MVSVVFLLMGALLKMLIESMFTNPKRIVKGKGLKRNEMEWEIEIYSFLISLFMIGMHQKLCLEYASKLMNGWERETLF